MGGILRLSDYILMGDIDRYRVFFQSSKSADWGQTRGPVLELTRPTESADGTVTAVSCLYKFDEGFI